MDINHTPRVDIGLGEAGDGDARIGSQFHLPVGRTAGNGKVDAAGRLLGIAKSQFGTADGVGTTFEHI